MNNKVKKIFIIIALMTIIIPIFSTTIFASTDLELGLLDNYKGDKVDSDKLESKASNIYGIIQVVGVVVSVVALMIIGIKYMMGSVEDKADYKNTLKPYAIGAFILFTGSLIPGIIYKIAQNI